MQTSRIARRERYYTGLRDDSGLRIKLSGNFEAIVGEQDTFCAQSRFPAMTMPLTLPRPHPGVRESCRLRRCVEEYSGFSCSLRVTRIIFRVPLTVV